jgi:hypothetical protein
MRPFAGSALVSSALLVSLAAAGCGGGGSSSERRLVAAAGDDQVVVSSGAREIPSDPTPANAVPASDKARLGIGALGRTYSLTTPAGAALELALSAIVPGARGAVAVRVALANGTGNAAADLRAAGLTLRSGNLVDRGGWLESVGDGFARITISGSVGAGQVLIVEREVGGKRTHGAVSLAIGPLGPANPSFPGGTSYTGLKSETALYSSDAPIFGLPAICGNGDRVSIAAYDAVYGTGTGGGGGGVGPALGLCVMPDVERRQRRFQLDTLTGAATMGETLVLGNDATNWRDTELAGLHNVIAIAQSGGDSVSVSFSLDRGATFPETHSLGSGGWSRLVQVDMADDYTLGVLYWSSVDDGLRLTLVEGRPTALDANNTPVGFAFGAPEVLIERPASTMPLVSDLRYSACGDLFVAFGYTDQASRPDGAWVRTTRVGAVRRLSGETTMRPPVTIDEMEIVGYDPSIAVLGCGDSAEVFVAYESQDGVRVARSLDGARSFPAKTSIGTTSANAPQLFARTLGGKDVLDCLFVDASPAGLGWDLCLLRVEDDLASGKSLHRIVEAKVVTGGMVTQEVEGLGWFGFDATELQDDLLVAVHTQRTQLYVPGLRGSAGGTGAIATSSAPAAPPPVLLPGMTQPVPPVDPAAPHKLKVLRIE